MSHERPGRPAIPTPSEVFGFTEREMLFNRVSAARFSAIVGDEPTTIHRVEESYNNYGEWVFVTASRAAGERRICVMFYGLGFHEYRERWFVDTWFFYQANAFPDMLDREVPKEEVAAAVWSELL